MEQHAAYVESAEEDKRQNVILREELGRHKAMLTEREAETTRLRLENDTYLTRIMEEKTKMIDEFNKLNALIAELQHKLRVSVSAARACCCTLLFCQHTEP